LVFKSVPSCTGGGGGGGGQEQKASIWRRIKIRAEVSYHGSFSETEETQLALVTFSFPQLFSVTFSRDGYNNGGLVVNLTLL
jgi:hypothetical protein